jgi:hypothetical protein
MLPLHVYESENRATIAVDGYLLKTKFAGRPGRRSGRSDCQHLVAEENPFCDERRRGI